MQQPFAGEQVVDQSIQPDPSCSCTAMSHSSRTHASCSHQSPDERHGPAAHRTSPEICPRFRDMTCEGLAFAVAHPDSNRRPKNSQRGDNLPGRDFGLPGVLSNWMGEALVTPRSGLRRREMAHFKRFSPMRIQQNRRSHSSLRRLRRNSRQRKFEFFRFRRSWNKKPILRWARLCRLNSQSHFCHWRSRRIRLSNPTAKV